MTEVQPPGFLNDPVETDAHPFRDALRVVLGGSAGAFAGGIGATNGDAHGVGGTGDLLVTQSASPGMSVDVAAGVAAITGTVSALQGPYTVRNSATVTKSIAAADSTNPRKDLVIAQVRDDDYSGADLDWRIHVVTGTPALSPADPSLASFPNALVLARVDVPAGDLQITNSQITDLRTFTARLAPRLIVAGATVSRGLGRLTVQSGSSVVTTNSSGFGTITFPTAFAAPPNMGCVIGGSETVPVIITLTETMPVTTGFNFRAYGMTTDATHNSLSVRVYWTAIGYVAT